MDEVKTLSVREAMLLAITEAKKGTPFVSPNPAVGCVILDRSGKFLSAGYHRQWGGPHAEVEALRLVKPEDLTGAHVIVTLEPCAHEGKTPSCAKALAKLPIKKVTYGLMDPNPLVAGQGGGIMRAAGIEVEEFSELQDELKEVCENFLINFEKNRISVALKVATSLDGQMALNSGESQWITGHQSREQAHYLRACYDAVLVGAGTVKKDDPALNVRLSQLQKINKVCVLDLRGELLQNYRSWKLSQVHRSENVYWCVDNKVEVPVTVDHPRILKIKTHMNEFDLRDLLDQLWKAGIRSILVEGGSQTLGSFLKASLADRLYLFMAPHLLGRGLSWTQNFHIPSMDHRKSLKEVRVHKVGEDLLITGRL